MFFLLIVPSILSVVTIILFRFGGPGRTPLASWWTTTMTIAILFVALASSMFLARVVSDHAILYYTYGIVRTHREHLRVADASRSWLIISNKDVLEAPVARAWELVFSVVFFPTAAVILVYSLIGTSRIFPSVTRELKKVFPEDARSGRRP